MYKEIKNSSFISYLWLLTGCVFLLFMGGKWNIPVTTWIGSVFFLRYFRTRRSFYAVLLALPPILLASHVYFTGLAEQVEVWFRIMIDLCFSLYIIVPCLADAFLNARIRNRFLSTLAYPASLIAVQFLLSYIEQLGTILHWTGSMFSSKAVIQMVSITGVWGPSFLVGWLASILNTLWEDRFDVVKNKASLITFSSVTLLAITWGGVRQTFFAPAPGTVKVGSVVAGFKEDNMFYIYEDMPEKEKAEKREEYLRLSRQVQDELFSLSGQLIPSGIRILAWASGNAVVFEEEEEQLIKRMQQFARDNRVYFFPSILVLGDYKGPDENHVLAIQPDGQIAYDHYKGRSPNAGYYQAKTIESVGTPYGRIASPICFEMEFHRLIRQAGRDKVDILIVPGDEPARGSSVMHTELSMLRAIENGCSMLRTTLEGVTMAADYQGRVLSEMNFYTTLKERTIVTEMPVKGIRTFYSMAGDWFAWSVIILLIYLVARAFIRP
jgi:apolipoprotein N-acyltransferase